MREFRVTVNNLDSPEEEIPKLLSYVSDAGGWSVFVDYYCLKDDKNVVVVIFNPVIIEDGRKLTEDETVDLMIEIVDVLGKGCIDLFKYDTVLEAIIDNEKHVFFTLGRTEMVIHVIQHPDDEEDTDDPNDI